MEQNIKLAFFCGNYAAASKTEQGKQAVVVGQTTETGQELLERGRNFYKEMAATPFGSIAVFSNNDHFLNGVRLSVIDGNLDPDEVEIYFFKDKDTGRPQWLNINKDGRINNWPAGFFDAIEDALSQII